MRFLVSTSLLLDFLVSSTILWHYFFFVIFLSHLKCFFSRQQFLSCVFSRIFKTRHLLINSPCIIVLFISLRWLYVQGNMFENNQVSLTKIVYFVTGTNLRTERQSQSLFLCLFNELRFEFFKYISIVYGLFFLKKFYILILSELADNF